MNGRRPIMLARLTPAKAMVCTASPTNGMRPSSPAAAHPTARLTSQNPAAVNISATTSTIPARNQISQSSMESKLQP